MKWSGGICRLFNALYCTSFDVCSSTISAVITRNTSLPTLILQCVLKFRKWFSVWYSACISSSLAKAHWRVDDGQLRSYSDLTSVYSQQLTVRVAWDSHITYWPYSPSYTAASVTPFTANFLSYKMAGEQIYCHFDWKIKNITILYARYISQLNRNYEMITENTIQIGAYHSCVEKYDILNYRYHW